jgi:hypothetical protein
MIRLWGLQGARPSHFSEGVLTRAIARELSPLRSFLANWHLDHCAPAGGESERSEKAIAAELASTILRLRTDGPAFIQNRGITGAMSTCPEPSPKL